MINEAVFAVNLKDLNPEQITKLYSRVGWNNINQRTDSKTAKMLEQTMIYATASVGGQVIGFGRILGDSYTGQLLDVMTDPDFRNQGIAKRIIEILLEEAKGKFIGLFLIDGTGKPKFYESFGFMEANSKTDRLMYLEGSPI